MRQRRKRVWLRQRLIAALFLFGALGCAVMQPRLAHAANAASAASAASARVAQAEHAQRVGPDDHRCSTDCHARIGIVSAFGAEADILQAQTKGQRVRVIHGIRFTTGTLRGHAVVIVLSGVSMINAAMTTQLMLDHFHIQRLIMSGIAGGVDPANHVGDVIVPERWMMPMEVYWNSDGAVPAPCGEAGEIGCLGLKLATRDGQVLVPYTLPTAQGALATGLFMRQTQVTRTGAVPGGEFRFDYLADPHMLAVARTLTPTLLRCARAKPDLCVSTQPILRVGGRAASGSAFLANADYRRYLFDTLQVQAIDMETAAFAHVAYANRIPFIAFRSLSDLAGGSNASDVGTFFGSGLAETNEASVTLAFLSAWPRGGRAQ